jgi:hypothetical protein
MKKSVKIALFFAILPFLLVWTAWLLTALSFNIHDVFQSGAFWGSSAIYWLVYVCLVGFIFDEVKD